MPDSYQSDDDKRRNDQPDSFIKHLNSLRNWDDLQKMIDECLNFIHDEKGRELLSAYVTLNKKSYTIMEEPYVRNLITKYMIRIEDEAVDRSEIFVRLSAAKILEGFTFKKNADAIVGNRLNKVARYPYEPKRSIEASKPFWEFVREIICAGDEAKYRYLRKWLAWLIRVTEKPRTAILMIGDKGTGKSIFQKTLCQLVGDANAWTAPDLKQLLDTRFTSSWLHMILVTVEEGSYADAVGNLNNRFKSIISDLKTPKEGKGKDQEMVNTYLGLTIATNDRDMERLEYEEERRFLVLPVSNHQVQNLMYYKKLVTHLEKTETMQAIMYDLIHEDLDDFMIQEIPKSLKGLERYLDRLEPLSRWLIEMAALGRIPGLEHVMLRHKSANPSPEPILKDEFFETYKSWVFARTGQFSDEAWFGKQLLSLVGPKTFAESRVNTEGKRKRVLQLPEMALLRKIIDSKFRPGQATWKEIRECFLSIESSAILD
jgi:hypothetical protein